MIVLLGEYILAGIWVHHGPEFRHNDPIGSSVLFVCFTLQEFTPVKYIPWKMTI